ncbi:hypothetical protein KUV50_04920 [Membranicola marinus]|uniref:Lipocalin-like domain-containing protein n=1 Tax=Membranihabitans marinus TaxID=1227546 RepID=A0A953HXB6_9BACT|nr:hypothetical protein [Membranihabitans marinus]MBY5957467.1 hypothetical protein [Membranihabitans marinus]
MNTVARILIIVLSAIFLLACSSHDPKRELILGNWTLQEAVRQGRTTSTLDGLNFTFTNDSLFTNIIAFGNNEYTYENDSVTILAEDPIVFNVFYVDSTELDLHGEIQQVRFRLKFEKMTP